MADRSSRLLPILLVIAGCTGDRVEPVPVAVAKAESTLIGEEARTATPIRAS